MIMMYDRITVDERSVRRTSDGYLVATPRVARTGIQVYAGKEVGKPDIDKVRVYRPESEVFAPDSLKSYAHRPITINHPSQPVTSDNWRRHAVGQTGDEVVRDGKFVRVPMVLMDADAIKMFESGHRELSQGYTCDLKWGTGETLQGETYDALQTDIRANHTAIVKDARGGRDLRIGDNEGYDTYECPHCGADVSIEDNECNECGYRLVEDEFVEDRRIDVKSGNPNRDPDGRFGRKEGGDITSGEETEHIPRKSDKDVPAPAGYAFGGVRKGEKRGVYVNEIGTNWRSGPFQTRREAAKEAAGHREGRTFSGMREASPHKMKDPNLSSKTETGLLDPDDLFDVPVDGKKVKLQGNYKASRRLVFKSENEAIDYIREQRKGWALAREENVEQKTTVRRRGLPGFFGFKERSKGSRWRIRFDSAFVDEPLIDEHVEVLSPIEIDLLDYDPNQPRNEQGEWTHTGLTKAKATANFTPEKFSSKEASQSHAQRQKDLWNAEFMSLEEARKFVIEQQKKWNKVKVREVTTTIEIDPFLGFKRKRQGPSHYVISHDGMIADAVIDHIISGDSEEEGETEMSKIITVDGVPVETTDIGAAIVQRTLDGYQKQIDEFKLFKKKSEEELEEERKKKAADSAMIAAKDAEIAVLSKKVADSVITPQRLDQMVRDRSDIVNRATSVLKDKLTTDGKTEAEIRRQVVDAHMGDVARGYTDDQVSAAFGVITKDYKPGEQADGKPRYNANDFAFDLSRSTQRLSDGDKAWEDSNKHLSEAWKGNGAAAQ